VWKGYTEPWDEFHFPECQVCHGTGYSFYAQVLQDRWYGKAPFHPAETGSTLLTAATPEVRAFAERNVSNSPDYYGTGEVAIVREAERLCDLWNKAWSHHLDQDDVDVLVEADRLRDFTHRFNPDGEGLDRWIPTGHHPTAEEVNRWSIKSFGHDSINCWVVVEAACERAGRPYTCGHCEGHGNTATDEQRQAADEVETYEPPLGAGWQLWETTSEGSPTSPVFSTAEALAEWCETNASYFADLKMTKDEWLSGFVNDTTDVDSLLVMSVPRGA
jgi:hypothetical protein